MKAGLNCSCFSKVYLQFFSEPEKHQIMSKNNAPGCKPSELDEFREIFSLVDQDRGGTITPDELVQLMDLLGVKATQEDMDALIQEVDKDGDGHLDFNGE